MLLATIVLSWPAIINGSALTFPDTASYYKGGALAVAKIRTILASVAGSGDGAAGAAAIDQTLEGVRGVRSAFYSLFVYVTSPGRSFGTVAIQGAVIAWLSLLLIRAAFPALHARAFLLVIVLVAAGTGAPWVTSYLMPDVFAAVVILATALLALYHRSLSRAELVALVLLLSFAITAHPTHLLLGGGLLVVAPLAARVAHGVWRETPAILTWLGLPLVLAVAGLLFVGIVGFKSVSVVPASEPFMLARAIDDGPAYRYIKERCPRERFVVCAFADRLPTRSAHVFLWEPDGVMSRASPAERAQIAAQEMDVVWAAIRAYPLEQLYASSRNVVRQLTAFGLGQFWWGRLDLSNPEDPSVPRYVEEERGFFAAFTAIHYAVVIASLLVILGLSFARTARLAREHLALVAVIGLGILGNAAICAVLSGPAERYQIRVVWLVPLLAAAIGIARLMRSR